MQHEAYSIIASRPYYVPYSDAVDPVDTCHGGGWVVTAILVVILCVLFSGKARG